METVLSIFGAILSIVAAVLKKKLTREKTAKEIALEAAEKARERTTMVRVMLSEGKTNEAISELDRVLSDLRMLRLRHKSGAFARPAGDRPNSG